MDYLEEYKRKYGLNNVIRILNDCGIVFLIVYHGRLIKIIKIKETKEKSYIPTLKDKLYFNKLVNLARQHRIPAELFLYFKRGRGKKSLRLVKRLYNPDGSSNKQKDS